MERYRALLCVLELGSLSTAAEKLGYTPSGVSRMMAALEEEAGFPLLLRRRDGVAPTADCRRMLPAIREFVFQGENCRQLAAKIRGLETGAVTVGTAYRVYYAPLAKAASSFHQKYPGIQVRIRGGYSTELLRLLEARQVDLCIVSRRPGGYDWLALLKDELVAWVPADHPLAQGTAVPLEAFETEPYIDTYPGLDIDNKHVFDRFRIRPNTCFTTMDNLASCSMVEAGLGISMNNALNTIAGHDGVYVMPLEPRCTVEVGIASLEPMAPAARAFLDFAGEDIRQFTKIVSGGML